jgi:UDP-2-acetamido-3-amino-2,3-dideoxy-glucuronate N-acetyltransferase
MLLAVPAGIDPSAVVHPTAVVDPGAAIGARTHIWHFCHVMGRARIGSDCILGQGVFVGSGVIVGNGVKVQNQVSLFEGVELEDDVFCGPSVVFTNVKNPRAHVSRRHEYGRTLVSRGATLGANATILPGVAIGRYAFVGAGATVTRDVPDFALAIGVPARVRGFMSRHGEPLRFVDGRATCVATGERYELTDGRVVLSEAAVE